MSEESLYFGIAFKMKSSIPEDELYDVFNDLYEEEDIDLGRGKDGYFFIAGEDLNSYHGYHYGMHSSEKRFSEVRSKILIFRTWAMRKRYGVEIDPNWKEFVDYYYNGTDRSPVVTSWEEI